jgi:hypothetical protein
MARHNTDDENSLNSKTTVIEGEAGVHVELINDSRFAVHRHID